MASSRAPVASAAAPVSRTKTAPAPASRNCSTPAKLWAAPRQLDRTSECQAAEFERLQTAPHLSLTQHANEPLAMFQRSIPLSCPRKWPWKSENGGFPIFFAFSASRLEMVFSSPVEIKEPAISNVQHVHPLRETACVGRRRPGQAVGRRAGLQLDLTGRVAHS